MSGNLGFQIEHHLFPDLPSNRYAEISVRVRALCEQYGIPYTTGPLHRQYGQALRTIWKLSLPNGMTSEPDPTPPPRRLPRRRLTDAERPVRPGDRQVVAAVGVTVDRDARSTVPLPADLADRPADPRHGVPVPFVSDAEDGTVQIGRIVKKRAIRCALSRICGLCGISLEWGVTFVGIGRGGRGQRVPLPRRCTAGARRRRCGSTRRSASRCSGSRRGSTRGRSSSPVGSSSNAPQAGRATSGWPSTPTRSPRTCGCPADRFLRGQPRPGGSPGARGQVGARPGDQGAGSSVRKVSPVTTRSPLGWGPSTAGAARRGRSPGPTRRSAGPCRVPSRRAAGCAPTRAGPGGRR